MSEEEQRRTPRRRGRKNRSPTEASSPPRSASRTRSSQVLIHPEDLPALPRVDRSNAVASTHRYKGHLSSLKLRVRLLEYLRLDKRGISPGDLAVVEDRIISWQQKIEPPPSNQGNLDDGHFIYTYVDADKLSRDKRAVREKRACIPIGEEDQIDEWEDLRADDDIEDVAEKALKPSEGDGDKKLAEKKAEEEIEKQSEAKMRTRDDIADRQEKVLHLVRKEEEAAENIIGKQARVQRPNASMSTSLLPHGYRRDRTINGESPKKKHGERIKKLSGRGPPILRRTLPIEQRASRRQAVPSQNMVIMAKIPNHDKNVAVCRLKAFPTAGIVNIKAPFGFRVIHATRQASYRLSWELHLPGRQGITKDKRKLAAEKEITWGPMSSFEMVGPSELRVFIMGEILSAKGFDSEPLCVHYILETPPGWKNLSGNSCGVTHSSFTTDEGVAFFSQEFSLQLAFSLDSLPTPDTPMPFPVLLIMVASIKDSGRVRYEGYGYTSIPFTPGPHTIRLSTWKPRARCVTEMMEDLFLDATPALKDPSVAHISANSGSSQVGCRLGLATEPSGQVSLRLHVIHQTPSSVKDQASKLELLEKMSSATILKSVQKVIEAFNRARSKALVVKGEASSRQRPKLMM